MDDRGLSGVPRAALVTGAGVRLGRALALALAEDGFHLALHCRNSVDEAEGLRAEIERLGRRALVLQADLADAEAVEGLMPKAAAELGPVGVLVNSAAVFANDRLATFARTNLDAHMAINLTAPLLLARDLVRQLPADAKAVVVNLLDQRLHNPTKSYLSYTVSKAGLEAATQVMARDLAPNVRVAAIGPGHVLPAPGMTQERFEALVAKTPLGIASGVEEIVGAFRLILHAPSLTGQTILVDSGMHMGWAWPG